MDRTFYDQAGAPVVYTEDGEHLYSFSGEPVGYYSGDSVHSFSGKHLGWCDDGWMRDHAGNAALFTEDASGGPIKPIKQIRPIKGIKQIKPIKGVREIVPIRPIKSLGWSSLSGLQFFRT